MKARVPDGRRGKRAHATTDDPPPTTLGHIYRRYSGLVWRLVRRGGVPEAAVEDVMHEVFVVVHRRLPEFDGRAAMTTWLYHITRGVVSNFRRGRSREARRLQLVQPRPAPVPDPEEHTRRRRAAEFVRSFIATLDDDKRRVFELAEIDGLPMPQVAEICGINVNTAHSRLRAARQRFQDAVNTLRRERAAQEAG